MKTSCQVKRDPSATEASVGLYLLMPLATSAETDSAPIEQSSTKQVSASGLVAPMAVRGKKNADGKDQSMVGALQPPVHVKLNGPEFERFNEGDMTALRDALLRGLPKELGERAAGILAEVFASNWEAALTEAPSILKLVGNETNPKMRQIHTFALDLRDVRVYGAPLDYGSFLNLVGDHVAPDKEVAGFVPLASNPGTITLNGQPITVIAPEQLEPIQKEARETKGERVIPDDKFQAFPDDIKAAQAAWSSQIVVPPLPRE